MDSWIVQGHQVQAKHAAAKCFLAPGVKPNDRSRPLVPPKIAQIPNQSAAGSGIWEGDVSSSCQSQMQTGCFLICTRGLTVCSARAQQAALTEAPRFIQKTDSKIHQNQKHQKVHTHDNITSQTFNATVQRLADFTHKFCLSLSLSVAYRWTCLSSHLFLSHTSPAKRSEWYSWAAIGRCRFFVNVCESEVLEAYLCIIVGT